MANQKTNTHRLERQAPELKIISETTRIESILNRINNPLSDGESYNIETLINANVGETAHLIECVDTWFNGPCLIIEEGSVYYKIVTDDEYSDYLAEKESKRERERLQSIRKAEQKKIDEKPWRHWLKEKFNGNVPSMKKTVVGALKREFRLEMGIVK